MRQKSRHIALVVALSAVISNISGAAFGAEISSDDPPTVYWLDWDYDVASYMGNGIVKTGEVYQAGVKGLDRYVKPAIGNLNSDIIFPIDKTPWLDERFYGDYILTARTGDDGRLKYGLFNQFWEMVVPTIYDSEAQAWAQVHIDHSTLWEIYPDPPVPNLVYIDSPGSRTGLLYGFEDDEGNLLVDYQFEYSMPFVGSDYARVNSAGRLGLLKNPLKADVMSEWAKEDIAAATEMGLVPSRCAGYYTFEITRSQMAALLVQYCELVQGHELPLPDRHPFADTTDPYIEKAYAKGLVQGSGNGTFAPDQVITREQVALMLYRALVESDPHWADGVSAPEGYEDLDTVSDWAKEAVSALIGRGVMKGISPTRIAPKAYCSTEQAISLVYRLTVAEE